VIDTLKTTTAGLGGFWLSMWNALPDVISILVGIATLIYLGIKIKKEI
tara:strand:+ start:175 stop:318 length:144 start_codon:yes stop_codon:yes gene_type:complete